jgi:hypothetical protein
VDVGSTIGLSVVLAAVSTAVVAALRLFAARRQGHPHNTARHA